MTTPAFSVGLHELDDGPKELSGPLTKEWAIQMLKGTDVQPSGDQDGEVSVLLTKNGSEVLVQGRLRITVEVPCARTLDPAIYELKPDVFLMLAPSGSEPEASSPRRERKKREKSKKNGGKGTGGWENDPELTESEAASDTYSGDQIVLDSFLREFILLEIPMVPLREDLRDAPFEANPPLPGAPDSAASVPEGEGPPGSSSEKPLDPRLSPLAELKARLENKE